MLSKIIEHCEENKEALHQTLGVAYYNLAVEYEHVKQFDKAIESFLKAQYFVKQNK
jgi:hypothetical protein